MSFEETNWIKTTWGEVASLEYGKALKDYKNVTEGYPVYGTNGPIGFTDKFLTNGPGIIIGRKGAYRGVHYSEGPFYVIDTAYYLMPFSTEQIDIKWAYYNLKNIDINNLDSGSAIPSTSRADFYSLNVLLPSVIEQVSIRKILDSLDKKIELNNSINKNLEEMAQALFKRWFIDFEFPNGNGEPYKSSGGEFEESELGLIPKGWRVGIVGEYSNVKSGYAFKSSWWRKDGVKVIKIKNISLNTIVLNDLDCVDEEYAAKATDFIARSGDILIAMTGATVGKIGLVPSVNEKLLVNQRVGKFFLGKNPFLRNGYLFCLLNHQEIVDQIIAGASGSAQPNISPSGIENIKVAYPSIDILNSFNRLIKPGLKSLAYNIHQNNSLAQIRDTLLPKLMSGEIRVPLDEEELVISE